MDEPTAGNGAAVPATMKIRVRTSLVFWVWLLAVPAFAQEVLDPAAFLAHIDTWKARTDQIAETVEKPNVTDQDLTDSRRELSQLRSGMDRAMSDQQPRLDELKASLAKLGPPPAAGSTAEPASVAAERRDLSEKAQTVEGALKRVGTLDIAVSRIVERITIRQRVLFTAALFRRTHGLLSPDFWAETTRNVRAQTETLTAIVSYWFDGVVAPRPWSAALAFLTIATSTGFIWYGSRRWPLSVFEADLGDHPPRRFRRNARALWAAAVIAASASGGSWLVLVIADQFGLIWPQIDRLATATLYGATEWILAVGIVNAMLASKRPAWRVVGIGDTQAKRLRVLLIAMVTIFTANRVMEDFNALAMAPISLTIAEDALTSILIGAILVAIVRTTWHTAPDGSALPHRGWPRWPRTTLSLLAAALIGSTLLGYVGFGRFLATQAVITGAILAAMYLSIMVAHDLSTPESVSESFLENNLRAWFKFDNDTIQQIGLGLALTLYCLILAIGMPLIMVQWGFNADDIGFWLLKVLNGFKIGKIDISVTAILTGLAVFGLGLLATRSVKRWLYDRFISKTRLDYGLQNTVNTSIGYAGFLVSAVLAISYAGIDLSNFALVAGALSVGIGFGLQNIVNNFVSGLILLFERPIKAGDWIGVGDRDGFVKRVGVRATILETIDRQSIVVPNAQLINSAVTNWMLSDNIGRIAIKVGISYGSDERQARDILLGIARAHPAVTTYPEPDVILADFGDSSVDLELRAFLTNIGRQIQVASDLRFAIRDAFRTAGIEIPFPQRDVHIRDDG